MMQVPQWFLILILQSSSDPDHLFEKPYFQEIEAFKAPIHSLFLLQQLTFVLQLTNLCLIESGGSLARLHSILSAMLKCSHLCIRCRVSRICLAALSSPWRSLVNLKFRLFHLPVGRFCNMLWDRWSCSYTLTGIVPHQGLVLIFFFIQI